MHIKLNGKPIEILTPLPLADFLKNYGISSTTGQVAVAVNDKIAFRSEWSTVIVNAGDRIEIIQAVQGG